MTRDEVLAMKPGCELDTKIEIEVFGLKPSKTTPGWVVEGVRARPPRPFSTDIAAAWEVLRHLKGYHIELVRHRGVWTAALDDGKRSFVVRANSAPEAICKVALLAVGVSGG